MNYIYTLKSYECNKKCPYCITKILKRKEPEDLDKLEIYLNSLKGEYDDFILSGNGEPSLYTFSDLEYIKTTAENSNKFKAFRVQTSGELFNQYDKLQLFKDWIKEITVISPIEQVDQQFYDYKNSYLLKTYSENNVRCNYVLLKKKFYNKEYINDITTLTERYPHIAIKFLDTNDEWIVKNGVPYSDYKTVVKDMESAFGTSIYNKDRGRYYFGDNITMSYGKDKGHDYIQIEEN